MCSTAPLGGLSPRDPEARFPRGPGHLRRSGGYTPAMSSKRRVLIVLGHARKASLCHHLLEIARETAEEVGAEVRIHDLLADGFDPSLRLEEEERHATPPSAKEDPLAHRYCEDVRWADTFVIVHPVWWFGPPAILKGWIDRIFVHSVAVHQPENGPPEGILKGRQALLIQTFNAPKAIDKVLFKNLAEAFWRRAVFFAVGIRPVKRVAIYSAEGITPGKLATHEKRLRRTLTSLLR
jgi:NAD(P)H dehydrogenase (quinone)